MSETATGALVPVEERRIIGHETASPCCSYAVSAEGPAGSAYGEEAFRYLLGLERKRAERSGRSFLMLLVDVKREDGTAGTMDRETAAAIFGGMSLALRETDFIGWYREGRVAGAVLAQHADTPHAGTVDVVRARVVERIKPLLAPAVAARVQTRVFQLPRARE